MLVTHESDVDLVIRLMSEAADENDDVADAPEPVVRLIEIGDKGMLFELRAWSKVRLHRPGTFKSDLNLAIVRKFRESNVRLADSGLLEVKMSDEEPVSSNGRPAKLKRA
jgi:small-conductance mechanosensitive channel